MPSNLRRAHQALDRAVDRLYRRNGFASESERMENLFSLYEKIHAPLGIGIKGTFDAPRIRIKKPIRAKRS